MWASGEVGKWESGNRRREKMDAGRFDVTRKPRSRSHLHEEVLSRRSVHDELDCTCADTTAGQSVEWRKGAKESHPSIEEQTD
jgi:hypothetical protein